MKRELLICVLIAVAACACSAADAPAKVFRLGIIGMDTSHVPAFTKQINDPKNGYFCRVVAGYPGGSPDVQSSWSRVKGYTAQLRDEFGVEIVDSIEALCTKVDGVLLESVDGRPHLAQAKPVIAAGKPLFIDKPMAGSLADVIAIFELAKEKNVPCWSSSSLRYGEGIYGMRDNSDIGKVIGCDAYGPCSLEPHHPDLYWYGVHGVEILFTIMGAGCQSVRRVQTDSAEHVVGVWNDGRVGTFRGIKSGKSGYGAMIYGTKQVTPSGKYSGYGALVEEIVKFFETGKPPVSAEETIEIFAFMTAADVSKARDGAAVSIAAVLKEARAEFAKR